MPKCRGGCGRRLKDPESIARGYGPVCARRLGITGPPSKPARASPPVLERLPTPAELEAAGQLAIPIEPAR